MNWKQLIWPILQNTNIILLAVSVLLSVFFLFFIKGRFKLNPDLKYYAILFYAFVTLLITTGSYIILNAQSAFFNFNSIFNTYWFFAVYIILGCGVGALLGLLIYRASILVYPQNTYQLINYSLVVIAPTLLYILLIQPFVTNFEYVGLKQVNNFKNTENTINTDYNPNNFKTLTQKPDAIFKPAMPAEYYDSLLLTLSNANSLSVTLKNGFNYKHALKNNNLQQLYAGSIANYLAVLATSDRIYNLSTLILLDQTGNIAYLKTYNNGVNRLAVSNNGKYILLNQSEADEDIAVKFMEAIEINP